MGFTAHLVAGFFCVLSLVFINKIAKELFMEQQVKKLSLKKWHIGAIVLFIIWFFWSIGSNTSSPSQPVAQEQNKIVETPETEILSKTEALKEFERLMNLSKKSGLVKSYEMNENTSLKIFVSNVWYSQEVQFKKDMIVKFSSLEEQIYGRHRLEVLDAYSNEKLAEITAFGGSAEIYK